MSVSRHLLELKDHQNILLYDCYKKPSKRMMDALIKSVRRGLYRIFGDVLKELSREYMEQAVSDILHKMGKRVPYDQLTPEDAARLKGYLEKVVNAVMRKSFDRTGGDYIGVQATLKWLSKMPIGRHNVSEFLPELFVRNPDGKFDLTVFTFIPTLQDDLYPLDIEIKIMELRNNIENIHPTCQKKGQDCETLYVEETTKKIAEYETLRQESEQKLRDAVNANATALLNIDTLQLADGTVNQIYRIVAKASRVNSELSSPVVSRKSTNESTESSESTQSKKGSPRIQKVIQTKQTSPLLKKQTH